VLSSHFGVRGCACTGICDHLDIKDYFTLKKKDIQPKQGTILSLIFLSGNEKTLLSFNNSLRTKLLVEESGK